MTGKISDDPDVVLNGTEKFAAERGGVNYGPLATSLATWLASLVQTLTNKTLADAVLTGNPTAPTPTAGDNDTSVATTAFVAAAVSAVGAPPVPATATPLVESGSGAVGSGTKYAREDHVHPAASGGGGSKAHGQCGLIKSGSNLLLYPKDGNQLIVNGVPCSIPDAGVTLAPTGLAAATFYYIYATASGAVINALEASTTSYAAQNGTGVRIKSGDATRTLVGAAYTDTGPAWADVDGKLLVLSYFNRRRKKSKTTFTTDRTSASDTLAELSTEIRCQFISWTDELVEFTLQGAPRASAAVNQCQASIALDGTTIGQSLTDALSYAPQAGVYLLGSTRSLNAGLTENAAHFSTVLGRAVSGSFTATWDARTALWLTVAG